MPTMQDDIIRLSTERLFEHRGAWEWVMKGVLNSVRGVLRIGPEHYVIGSRIRILEMSSFIAQLDNTMISITRRLRIDYQGPRSWVNRTMDRNLVGSVTFGDHQAIRCVQYLCEAKDVDSNIQATKLSPLYARAVIGDLAAIVRLREIESIDMPSPPNIERAVESAEAWGVTDLLRPATTICPVQGCYCGDVCMAPRVMGRQMPCRRRCCENGMFSEQHECTKSGGRE